MKILGVDPGSSRCGYGLIEKTGSKLTFIKAGLIEIKENDINQKLFYLANDYKKILRQNQPKLVGIEKIFFSKNIKTAIEVAQARGVLILETLRQKIPLVEFTPQEIKLAVTNYGSADKMAVAKMVNIILGRQDINVIDDVSDAIATAIAAANNTELIHTWQTSLDFYTSSQLKQILIKKGRFDCIYLTKLLNNGKKILRGRD